MKSLKISFICLLALNSLMFTSCSDDDCTAPDVSANIVGTWEIMGNEVEFQSDGTLIDTNDALIGGESNGVAFTVKTWSATNTVLTVDAAAPDGSGNIGADLDIADNQCDEITFSLLGISVSMKRK